MTGITQFQGDYVNMTRLVMLMAKVHGGVVLIETHKRFAIVWTIQSRAFRISHALCWAADQCKTSLRFMYITGCCHFLFCWLFANIFFFLALTSSRQADNVDAFATSIRLFATGYSVLHSLIPFYNFLWSAKEVLRGMYYTAALMAHSCVVNAQISIDFQSQMTVKATVPIQEGETASIVFIFWKPLNF